MLKPTDSKPAFDHVHPRQSLDRMIKPSAKGNGVGAEFTITWRVYTDPNGKDWMTWDTPEVVGEPLADIHEGYEFMAKMWRRAFQRAAKIRQSKKAA